MRFCALLTILGLLTVGCGKDIREEPLRLSTDIIECGMEGGIFVINVSGPQDWVTDNTAEWISIEKKDGAAEIEVAANSGAARQSEINFSASGQKAGITIIQEHSDIFSVSLTDFRSPYKESEFRVEVECHMPWRIENSNEWISCDISGSDKPESVGFTVHQSFEREGRAGVIYFICGERIHSLTVSQDPSPYIALEKNSVEIDGDGGIIQTLYISNTDVTITPEDSWIRHIDTGADVKMVAFEIIRNLSTERTGHVRISSVADEGYFKILTIRQGEKIDHPKIEFEEGVSLTVHDRGTLTLHPVFEDMKDTSLRWSSDSPATASVDDSGNVTIRTGGSCVITAYNPFHKVSASIRLEIKIRAGDMTLFLGTQDMSENPVAVRFPGEAMTVRIKMDPEDAYCDDAVCISSDPSVVSVSGMTVRCLKPGKVSISVESLYQNLRKSFSILVLED